MQLSRFYQAQRHKTEVRMLNLIKFVERDRTISKKKIDQIEEDKNDLRWTTISKKSEVEESKIYFIPKILCQLSKLKWKREIQYEIKTVVLKKLFR